jgi:acyl dehydratase
MTVVNAIEDLHGHLGQEVGVSEWHEVTQWDVDVFADVTGDRQWIHVDVEAARSGPFQGTVAHGFYTLSLIPMLMGQVLSLENFGFVVNYGLNRVRFPAPMPVGDRVRLRLSIEAIEPRPGSTDLTFLASLESARQAKPVCVAESIVRIFEVRS